MKQIKAEVLISPSNDKHNVVRKGNTQLRNLAERIEESKVTTFDGAQRVVEYKYKVYVDPDKIEDLERIINDMLVEIPINLIVNDNFFKARVNSTVDLSKYL